MCWTGGRAAHVRVAVLAALLSLASACVAADAMAAEPDGSALSRAHDAYARGASAFSQGDYARAARELAAADALVPDSVTLRAALEAVTLADDPILGTELIERAARSPLDPVLAHALGLAQARFAHRTSVITVQCDGCLALVDGNAARVGARQIVLPGVHLVTVQRSGPPEPRLVTVAADELREVTFGAHLDPPSGSGSPATPPRPPSEVQGANVGASPIWFAGLAGATVVLGALSVWSAVDTANDHARFQSAECGVTAGSGCDSLASTGQSAQTRTTWLLVGTGAAAVGTAALGAFGVRWHEARVAASGAGVTFRLTF